MEEPFVLIIIICLLNKFLLKCILSCSKDSTMHAESKHFKKSACYSVGTETMRDVDKLSFVAHCKKIREASFFVGYHKNERIHNKSIFVNNP